MFVKFSYTQEMGREKGRNGREQREGQKEGSSARDRTPFLVNVVEEGIDVVSVWMEM